MERLRSAVAQGVQTAYQTGNVLGSPINQAAADHNAIAISVNIPSDLDVEVAQAGGSISQIQLNRAAHEAAVDEIAQEFRNADFIVTRNVFSKSERLPQLLT